MSEPEHGSEPSTRRRPYSRSEPSEESQPVLSSEPAQGEYQRNLFAKAILLRELRDAGNPTENELLERVDRACCEVGKRDPSFDFVYWADGTFWDLCDLFAQWGFLERSRSRLRITLNGLRFLEKAEASHTARAIRHT